MATVEEHLEYVRRLEIAAKRFGAEFAPIQASLTKITYNQDRAWSAQRAQTATLTSMLAVSSLQLDALATIDRTLQSIAGDLGVIRDLLAHPKRTEGVELRDLGIKALQREKLDLARRSFVESLDLYRHDPLTHFFLAQTEARLGRPNEALVEYELCMDYALDDSEAPLVAGAALRASALERSQGAPDRRRLLETAISQILPRRCPQLFLAIGLDQKDPGLLARALSDDPILVLDASLSDPELAQQAARIACEEWSALREAAVNGVTVGVSRLSKAYGVALPSFHPGPVPAGPEEELLYDVQTLAWTGDFVEQLGRHDFGLVATKPRTEVRGGCLLNGLGALLGSAVASALLVGNDAESTGGPGSGLLLLGMLVLPVLGWWLVSVILGGVERAGTAAFT